MIDKITAVSRAKLGARLGRLSDQDMLRIGRWSCFSGSAEPLWVRGRRIG